MGKACLFLGKLEIYEFAEKRNTFL